MARYNVETPAGTKRRTVYGKTRAEVRDKLAKALAERADGLVFDDENMTVGEYVTRWLEDSAKGGLAHRTYANYELQIRRHIVPAIERVKLAKLNPAHVQGLYAAKLRDGLKPSSVRCIHSVLRRSLEQAVRWNLIPRNPAALADPPKVRKEEIKPLNAEQARTLLRVAGETGDRYESLYVLSLAAGLRFVQHLAGHASIQLTLDCYSHWMPTMGKHTASAMDEVLDEADREDAPNGEKDVL